jgi:small subunit ribosomal protein S21
MQIAVDRAGNCMSQIIVSPGSSFEVALKQFNRKVQQAGILSEARRRSHYESPQAQRKRKAEALRRKQQRSSRFSH